jgi:multidrug efflux pump subunit AcrA (membrane-fusion protein)
MTVWCRRYPLRVSGNQDSTEGTPTWLNDYHPIDVDVSTLERFAKALQDEVDLNLTPHIGRIFGGLDPAHSPFIREPDFLELHNAWYTYGTRKAETLRIVQGFADATAQLAEAARLLAANYRNSDQLAAARLSDVQQALSQAQHPEASAW